LPPSHFLASFLLLHATERLLHANAIERFVQNHEALLNLQLNKQFKEATFEIGDLLGY
jgi:ferritin